MKKKMSHHTLSFSILDNLEPIVDETRIYINDSDLLKEIKNFLTKYEDSIPYYSLYFKKSDIEEIYNELLYDGYWVLNRYQKYYVIAFSIDYKRFYIFSKGCPAKIIDFKGRTKETEIIKNINLNSNYNENPVITLMRQIHNYE